MLRVNEIKLPLDADRRAAYSAVAKSLRISEGDILSLKISKRSVDSRKKDNIFFVYSFDVELNADEDTIARAFPDSKVFKTEEYRYTMPENKRVSKFRPVVVGFGPAGMFASLVLAQAGLRPLIIERGNDVDTRTKDVKSFWSTRVLNENSNVQFGEGGAGTFSDGKLTTGIKDKRCRKIFEEFVANGAPEDILWSGTPHIGTDKLGEVVKSIRKKVIAMGGEVLFGCRLTDIITANKAVFGVSYEKPDGTITDFETDTVLLCIGHSARDTLEMLYAKGLEIMQKPFSAGARIEHPQIMINKAQYGAFYNHPSLAAADYKLACHPPHGRGLYTFCMCPGGTVVTASSENGCVVVNGMSEYARDGENANSALLVGIEPEDFPSAHPLAGMYMQRGIEKAAFAAGGESYCAPAQLLGDFLKNTPSKKLGSVNPSCPTGVVPGDLRRVLPKKVTETLAGSIADFDRKLHGFALPDAVLTGPETRSSSPVRIVRDDLYQTRIRGLYPCGEGAGYAGGIVSAGVDGLRVAETVLSDER
ncbi:MAG: hypothetical protein GX051_00750 [Clostridiales bacterium]|nr:hypothetical protein [Clostridiales bacterium]